MDDKSVRAHVRSYVGAANQVKLIFPTLKNDQDVTFPVQLTHKSLRMRSTAKVAILQHDCK